MSINTQQMDKGEAVFKSIVKKLTLNLFATGCEPKNYEILLKLPLTASEIEKEFKLTRQPANKRIKSLLDAKLVSRAKAGERIMLTEVGKEFMQMTADLQNKVTEQATELIGGN